MKYFFLTLIIFLTSCSFNKNSSYWNADPIKTSLQDKKISKIIKKSTNFNNMTFNEYNLFLNNYSDKTDYPDINQ